MTRIAAIRCEPAWDLSAWRLGLGAFYLGLLIFWRWNMVKHWGMR